MNETTLTVCGNVVADPRHVVTGDGLPITSFRLASTARRFDRARGEWLDGETTFVGVSCFRSAAVHAADSLRKGERVLVHGRLRVRPWQNEERSGTSVEIEALALGHDLAFGRSSFVRASRAGGGPAAADPSGAAGPERWAGERDAEADGAHDALAAAAAPLVATAGVS